MEPFLEIFGDLTISFVVKIFCAIAFAGGAIAVGAKQVRAWYDRRRERDRKYHEVMDQVAKYPEWR